MDGITTPPRSRAGRPTREQADARRAELLDRALDLFLDHGFELTTIDAIAAALGMTKRTIYAAYADKAALFRAAVARAVARYRLSHEDLRELECDDLAATLTAIAHARIANLTTPEGLRLQRILAAESFRFPDIFELFTREAVQPVLATLADLFVRRTASGAVAIDQPERTAAAFMSLVTGGPARSFVAGAAIAPAELDERIRFSVRLFLDGVRPRHGRG